MRDNRDFNFDQLLTARPRTVPPTVLIATWAVSAKVVAIAESFGLIIITFLCDFLSGCSVINTWLLPVPEGAMVWISLA